jgi:hypothetical protein
LILAQGTLGIELEIYQFRCVKRYDDLALIGRCRNDRLAWRGGPLVDTICGSNMTKSMRVDLK